LALQQLLPLSPEGFSSNCNSDEELQLEPANKKLKLNEENESSSNCAKPSTSLSPSFPTLKDVFEGQNKFQFSVRLKLPKEESSSSTSSKITASSSTNSVVSNSNTPTNNNTRRKKMEKFSPEKVGDFKHVVYNLLVDNYNDPQNGSFAHPIQIEEKGKIHYGFSFNPEMHPEKKIPELYAQYIRKDRLDVQDFRCVCIQDLYKFYFRAAMELLAKYFDKHGKYSFLYKDVPLFVAEASLEEAANRIKQIKPKKQNVKENNNKTKIPH